MENENLTIELERAFETIEEFITQYVIQMQHPVELITNVIAALDVSGDPIVNRANLETLQRTIGHMDQVLDKLVRELEGFSFRVPENA